MTPRPRLPARPPCPTPTLHPPDDAQPDILDADGNVLGELASGGPAGAGSEPGSGAPAPDRAGPAVALPSLSSGPNLPSKKGDLLAYYLAEVRQYPLLEPEEEKDLAVRYQEEGDAEAAHRLVTANLRLVVKLAFQYHRQWSNVLDLIQEGNVGLVEALSRYDPYRGIRFSSYAQYWIRAMILRFLMDNYRMVRLGSTRHGRKLFFQLQKERDRLIAQGVQPNTLALAEALNVPEQEIINVDQHLRARPLAARARRRRGPPFPRWSRTRAPARPTRRWSAESSAPSSRTASRTSRRPFGTTGRAIWGRRLTSQDPDSLATLRAEFGVSKGVRQLGRASSAACGTTSPTSSGMRSPSSSTCPAPDRPADARPAQTRRPEAAAVAHEDGARHPVELLHEPLRGRQLVARVDPRHAHEHESARSERRRIPDRLSLGLEDRFDHDGIRLSARLASTSSRCRVPWASVHRAQRDPQPRHWSLRVSRWARNSMGSPLCSLPFHQTTISPSPRLRLPLMGRIHIEDFSMSDIWRIRRTTGTMRSGSSPGQPKATMLESSPPMPLAWPRSRSPTRGRAR